MKGKTPGPSVLKLFTLLVCKLRFMFCSLFSRFMFNPRLTRTERAADKMEISPKFDTLIYLNMYIRSFFM